LAGTIVVDRIESDASYASTINVASNITFSNTVYFGNTVTFFGTGLAFENSLITSGTAVASTSGTNIDFTGIPSNVKRITVMFQSVSTSGTSIVQIQLGTGATPTYTTSGYLGAGSFNATETLLLTGITVFDTVASSSFNGAITLTNITGNSWVATGVIASHSAASISHSAAAISLGADLTAIRITTVNGTDTFDAGTINILLE